MGVHTPSRVGFVVRGKALLLILLLSRSKGRQLTNTYFGCIQTCFYGVLVLGEVSVSGALCEALHYLQSAVVPRIFVVVQSLVELIDTDVKLAPQLPGIDKAQYYSGSVITVRVCVPDGSYRYYRLRETSLASYLVSDVPKTLPTAELAFNGKSLSSASSPAQLSHFRCCFLNLFWCLRTGATVSAAKQRCTVKVFIKGLFCTLSYHLQG